MEGGMGTLKDYRNVAWSRTTERFLQWCGFVLPLQCRMEMDGKNIAMKEEREAYDKMLWSCIVASTHVWRARAKGRKVGVGVSNYVANSESR